MTGILVGYARTSTFDQVAGLETQQMALKDLGCEEIFQEQVSATGKRPRLDEALRFIRKDDILVVTKLDRLARSIKHLGEIVEALDSKKASLRILNLNLDTGTPTGKLILNMLGSVAQFEREMMLERQKEGIAKAKLEGRYKGRPKKIDPQEVQLLLKQGNSVSQIQKELGISRASVYRLRSQNGTISAGGTNYSWGERTGYHHLFLLLPMECEFDPYPGVVILCDSHMKDSSIHEVRNLARELPGLMDERQDEPLIYWWLEDSTKKLDEMIKKLGPNPTYIG